VRLPFAVAFVLALLLLAASKVQAGTERLTNQDTVEVDAVMSTAGVWHHRKGPVHPFSDGVIVVCEEFKDKTTMLCIVLTDDGDVVLAPVQLLEQKT
jgi:hypothetical protein